MLIILLGLILGIIIVPRRDTHTAVRQIEKTSVTTPPPATPSKIHGHILEDPRRLSYGDHDRPLFEEIDRLYRLPSLMNNVPTPRFPNTTPGIFIQPPSGNTRNNEKALVENWKKSIVGLIKLADQNLRLAKQHLIRGNPEATIQTAATSVENIARALIHCFGGKPDVNRGQEEALRLLRQRFMGKEKEMFEKSLENVACVDAHVRSSTPTSKPSETEAEQTLESASEVTDAFKRILTEHFAEEISELSEACPQCRSLEHDALSFSPHASTFECRNCHHRWTET